MNKKKPISLSIEKHKSHPNKNELIKSLTRDIEEIEQQISQTSMDLLKVQMAGIRAKYSPENHWIKNLQKKFYWSIIEKSSSAHRDELIYLKKERKRLEIIIDKLKGQFWRKRIEYWFKLFIQLIILFFVLSIILLGLITSLYLIPIWGSMMLLYIILKKRRNK